MTSLSYIIDLSCSSCGKSVDAAQIHTYCTDCNAPLLANYDLRSLKIKLDREQLSRRHKGMWRWSELLPVSKRYKITIEYQEYYIFPK